MPKKRQRKKKSVTFSILKKKGKKLVPLTGRPLSPKKLGKFFIDKKAKVPPLFAVKKVNGKIVKKTRL